MTSIMANHKDGSKQSALYKPEQRCDHNLWITNLSNNFFIIKSTLQPVADVKQFNFFYFATIFPRNLYYHLKYLNSLLKRKIFRTCV